MMKQINIRVEDEIKSAFLRFCKGQDIGPNEALATIVKTWARAQLLKEKFEAKAIDRTGALMEAGRLIQDLQKFARLDGQFRQAVASAADQYQIKISELGL
jgi:hypothetical protein